uniref:Uncharacterized protein n=1 Tax=viral metagenome TaxID=1070528 RepID=A0A6C0HWX9_9ZZZZ
MSFAVSFPSPVGIVIDGTSSYVYVANNGGSNIAKFNLTYDSNLSIVDASWVTGVTNPRYLVIDPSGEYMYATSTFNSQIAKINMVDGNLNADWVSLPNGSSLGGLVIDPTGQYLYVANYGSENTICKIDISTGNSINWVNIIAPVGLIMDTIGTYLYCSTGAYIQQIDISNATITNSTWTTFPDDYIIEDMVIDYRQFFMYAPNSNGDSICQISPITGNLFNTTFLVGLNSPSGITMLPNRNTLFVSDTGNNRIMIYILPSF